LLLAPFRKFAHNPERILGPHIRAGMTVLDVGCAMGFFSLPLARMVGAQGKVVCIDVQERMLRALHRRAVKAGLADRIVEHLATSGSLGLAEFEAGIDFALVFAVVHEVPDAPGLFAEVLKALRPGARCLVAEPIFHVREAAFEVTLAAAREKGLELVERPRIARSRAALLTKPGG
jgi:ubiquinone/menaquinone biosynthesis C-methylase UbiE